MGLHMLCIFDRQLRVPHACQKAVPLLWSCLSPGQPVTDAAVAGGCQQDKWEALHINCHHVDFFHGLSMLDATQHVWTHLHAD
jgi:hypothetical protein